MADEPGSTGFARGFGALARKHDVALVGGDTTCRPAVHLRAVAGLCERAGRRCCASGGKPGDALFVSGTPGDAAAGLLLERGEPRCVRCTSHGAYLRERFPLPTPRVELGMRLSAYAQRLHRRFRRPARRRRQARDGQRLRRRDRVRAAAAFGGSCVAAVGDERARASWRSRGGDDYELCFRRASVTPSVSQTRDAIRSVGIPPHRRRCARRQEQS